VTRGSLVGACRLEQAGEWSQQRVHGQVIYKRRASLASFSRLERVRLSDRVIIVGGGPAGLMAAGRAAECGATVLLIEKTARLGNKLRLTGGGRGNIAHVGRPTSIVEHLGPTGPRFLPALERFGPQELIAFMEELGVSTMVERDGRVFPSAQGAHGVVIALRSWCLSHGVTFRYRSPVTGLLVDESVACGFAIYDLQIRSLAVILATGWMSYPQTGSTGDGYALAQRVGHRMISPAPGLVPLVASDAWLVSLAGLSLKDVTLTAYQQGKALGQTRGDVVFAPYGLSGPAALDLSSMVSRAFERGAILLSVDLKPDWSAQDIDAALKDAFAQRGRATLVTILQAHLPASLAKIICQLANVPVARPVAELPSATRRDIVSLLKQLEMHLVSTRPLQEAMVTLGGVAVDEIDPLTMGSRLVSGLYFAGELLDVAGETGGYNLQLAFSTGRLAGESAARAEQRMR